MTETEMRALARLVAEEIRSQPLQVIDVTPALNDDDPEDDGLTADQRLQLERRDAAMKAAGMVSP